MTLKNKQVVIHIAACFGGGSSGTNHGLRTENNETIQG